MNYLQTISIPPKGMVDIFFLLQYQFFHMVDPLKEFQILKELGCGSYGRVQLIRRHGDQRYYALKSVFLGGAKQKQKEAALNEIRLLASIDMPYVISYKSSFFLPDTQALCIIMEYADGGDLERMIEQRIEMHLPKGFEQEFIWRSAFTILKGLRGLHENNIIHRDLKCANIFYVGGLAKIGDLNISKLTDNGFASTQTGTPYYTSPQIWKGAKYDNKCDIWALGCILYEMCMLEPPFRADDFPGLFQAVTQGQYSPISSCYSKALRDLIGLCLKLTPSQRPSACELLQKPFFAQYELSIESLKSDIQSQSKVNMLDPIQCPKVLKFLNERLPKSKFEEGKKTVCFAGRQMESSAAFKIKTKKIRSQKTIIIDQQQKSPKPIKKIPTFLQNKSNVKLPPLEKETPGKSIKSCHRLPQPRQQCRSMKAIPQKQNRKQITK